MMRKAKNRNRNNRIVFYLNNDEMALLQGKLDESSVVNREEFIRKMLFDGRIVRVEFVEIREMIRLLRSSSNNLNQLAKKANETQNIYEQDVVELRENYTILLNVAKDFYSKIVDL